MVSIEFIDFISESILKEKSYQFALRIVKIYKFICSEKNEYILSKQVLRADASIGVNIEEANQLQSRSNFIHKLSIVQK